MPAPSTIVYITDADGDEFPIRLWGHYEGGAKMRLYVIQQAMEELHSFIERGEMNPTFPVTYPRIEEID